VPCPAGRGCAAGDRREGLPPKARPGRGCRFILLGSPSDLNRMASGHPPDILRTSRTFREGIYDHRRRRDQGRVGQVDRRHQPHHHARRRGTRRAPGRRRRSGDLHRLHEPARGVTPGWRGIHLHRPDRRRGPLGRPAPRAEACARHHRHRRSRHGQSARGPLDLPHVPRPVRASLLRRVDPRQGRAACRGGAGREPRAAGAFINRAEARGAENGEAAELIRSKPGLKFVSTSLGTRKAFAHAAAAGLAVTELRPQDQKASDEIGALYGHLFDTSRISGRDQEGV
jgi:hypothetical protein